MEAIGFSIIVPPAGDPQRSVFNKMETFKLEYNLAEAGWADAIVRNENDSITMTASYLHDSLCDLANAAKALIHGSESATAVFMDEPGEHQLIFERNDKQILYEIRWFEDWASWNMHPKEKYDTVLYGKASLRRVTGEIYDTLKRIYEKYSLEKYKELWIEHEFPLSEFNYLRSLRETEQDT